MHIQNFDPYDFSKKEIEGVPVYYKNLPWAPCIHIRIVFNVGAFEDPGGKEGLSHFLEHMIFDGSPSLPDKKAIQEWKKLYTLNTWNASTRFGSTTYWLKCLPEKFNIVLSGMKDMIFNSYIRPEDVEHERKVITQEAWGRFQNEKFLQYTQEVIRNIYSEHSRERFNTPLGWPATIANLTREDIATWHKTKYGKGNFFIVLAGAVKENHLEVLGEFLKDIPEIIPLPKPIETFKKPFNPRFVKTADEIGEVKEQVEISILRFGKPLPEDAESISGIFRQLTYDILNERMRIENSLCYSIGLYVHSDKSFFEAGMNVRTEEKNIEIVETEFWKIIQEIEIGKHTERFEKIKALTVEQIRSQERLSGDIADNTVSDILAYEGHVQTLKENIDSVEKVSYKDIINFTQETFDPEYCFTEIILPSKK